MHGLPSEISIENYLATYNALSMSIAAMGASTIFFFMHSAWVAAKFKTAMTITGLVTFIAFYHYFRIYNSWTEAYNPICMYDDKKVYSCTVKATGAPFNDAYRYMDWLLTVPLLLVELILVMKLPQDRQTSLSWKLGAAAALMIILGYPGEISDSSTNRWIFWAAAMIPFLYIVYTLFVGLKEAVDKQEPAVRSLISMARYVTILSWCTYPIVFILPMLGLQRDSSEVGIQIGYTIADIISKCGVGLMITKISITSTKMMKAGAWSESSYESDALIQ